MESKKIKNFKDLFDWIKEENSSYFKKIEAEGDIGSFLRALTAQFLWLATLYHISRILLPIQDFLIANAMLFATFGLLSLLWRNIKDKLPLWASSFINGDFFYRFDVYFLNFFILILLMFNLVLIFIPSDLFKRLTKKNE